MNVRVLRERDEKNKIMTDRKTESSLIHQATLLVGILRQAMYRTRAVDLAKRWREQQRCKGLVRSIIYNAFLFAVVKFFLNREMSQMYQINSQYDICFRLIPLLLLAITLASSQQVSN